jgi:hypothetical protein
MMEPMDSDGPATKPDNKNNHDFTRLNDIESCPPPSADMREGIFYAFHASDPPGPADFKTAAGRGVYSGKDECKRRSNSIFSNLEEIGNLCASMRRRGRGLVCRYISAGKITPNSGVAVEDEGCHYSFWVCGKTSMHAIFTNRVK